MCAHQRVFFKMNDIHPLRIGHRLQGEIFKNNEAVRYSIKCFGTELPPVEKLRND